MMQAAQLSGNKTPRGEWEKPYNR